MIRPKNYWNAGVAIRAAKRSLEAAGSLYREGSRAAEQKKLREAREDLQIALNYIDNAEKAARENLTTAQKWR